MAQAAFCGETYNILEPKSCNCGSGANNMEDNGSMGLMVCCGWISADGMQCLSNQPTPTPLQPSASPIPTQSQTINCGETYNTSNLKTCSCSSGTVTISGTGTGGTTICCGWLSADGNNCLASDPTDLGNPAQPVTKNFFDNINPLNIGGSQDITQNTPSAFAAQLSKPGGIISRLLTFIFPLSGMVLFVMLLWGGFEMMTGAASKKNLESGKNRAVAAVVGFLLLFASYWITQIVQQILGIKILY